MSGGGACGNTLRLGLMNNKQVQIGYTHTHTHSSSYHLPSPPSSCTLHIPPCLCMAPCFICIGCITPPVVTGTDDTGCIKNDDPPTDYCAVVAHTNTHSVTENISQWELITAALQPSIKHGGKTTQKAAASQNNLTLTPPTAGRDTAKCSHAENCLNYLLYEHGELTQDAQEAAVWAGWNMQSSWEQ